LRRLFRVFPAYLATIAVTVTIGTWHGGLIAANPGHAVWAATVAAVAATFAPAYALRDRPIPRGRSFLGRVSYSLYLVHVVVLALLGRLLPDLADRPAGTRIAAGAASLALAVAVAWVFQRWIEAPGQRLGGRLARRFAATERAAAPTGRGENVSASV
jgi:peptidoglycan/LPS O-acetylase OafA/YrhL